MYTCTIIGGDLSAVDLVYGWKVKAMFSWGPKQLTLLSVIKPLQSIQKPAINQQKTNIYLHT